MVDTVSLVPAVEILGVTKETVRLWARRGEIAARRRLLAALQRSSSIATASTTSTVAGAANRPVARRPKQNRQPLRIAGHCPGSSSRTRTYNPAVNSRVLYRLSYRGIVPNHRRRLLLYSRTNLLAIGNLYFLCCSFTYFVFAVNNSCTKFGNAKQLR